MNDDAPDSTEAPHNEALAQALAEALAKDGALLSLEPVVAAYAPRNPWAMPVPHWCVVAGPRSPPRRRHVVALVGPDEVISQAPPAVSETRRTRIKTVDDLRACADQLVSEVARWMQVAPHVDGLVDKTFAALAAVVERHPGRHWVCTTSGRDGAVTLLHQHRQWPVHLRVDASHDVDDHDVAAVDRDLVACDEFFARAAALERCARAVVRTLGPLWSFSCNNTAFQLEEVPRASFVHGEGDARFAVGSLWFDRERGVHRCEHWRRGHDLDIVDGSIEAKDVVAALARDLAAERARLDVVVSPSGLQKGRRLRLLQPLHGVTTGTVVVCAGEKQVDGEVFVTAFERDDGSAAFDLHDDGRDDDVIDALDEFFAFA